jgi:hypothetical protein
MGHWDRLRFGGEELGVIWICRIGQDPLPASRSCHGNHEGKEGMEWKVSCPLAKHPRLFGIGAQNQFWLLPAERGQS